MYERNELKGIYSWIALVFLFVVLVACSSLKSDVSFQNVQYSEDKLDHILKIVSNPKSDFHFEKVLDKYLHDSSFLNYGESVALLFGALKHSGYNDTSRMRLELETDLLIEIKEYEEAIKLSDSCLDIFPLSAKATANKWYAFLKLEQEDSSDLYYKRLATIFKGMQSSGFSFYLDGQNIALSKNAIDEYVTKHAAGAGLEFESEFMDEDGNLIVEYSGIVGKEVFIIPKVD